MPEKFRNRYRIPSTRLANWDYRWNAPYYITICTKHREHYFGHIVDGKMELSSIGIIADVLWHEIKNHTRNVELDAFVVMPNHIHGILIINDDLMKPWNDNGTNSNSERNFRFETDPVETLHATSLPSPPPTSLPS